MKIPAALLLTALGSLLTPLQATDLTSAAPILVAQVQIEDPATIKSNEQELLPRQTKKPDIHYVPTPPELVAEMLRVAKMSKDDVLYDLGSGDGRIVITAAKEFGTRGTGIDIDPVRIEEAQDNAKAAGVQDKVKFLEQDLFESDFSEATVITLYLLESLNKRVRPKILAETKPGTRVVSHAFGMGEWEPDQQISADVGGSQYQGFYWIVPANMSGTWKINGGEGLPDSVTVEQDYQKITLKQGGKELGTGKLDGKNFTVTIAGEGEGGMFKGTVDGDTATATKDGTPVAKFTAQREPGTQKPLE